MSVLAVLTALLLLGGCGPPGGDTRDERLARIDEMYGRYHRQFPEVEDIGVAELVGELEGDRPPVLVDVRTDAEREVSIIPGAVSQQEFESRLDDFEGRRVVTYCTIGYRSGLYADELRRRGVEVANLEGSILAWTYSGRDLESHGRPTRRVHVYGERWNLAAPDFEVVW